MYVLPLARSLFFAATFSAQFCAILDSSRLCFKGATKCFFLNSLWAFKASFIKSSCVLSISTSTGFVLIDGTTWRVGTVTLGDNSTNFVDFAGTAFKLSYIGCFKASFGIEKIAFGGWILSLNLPNRFPAG